jgi:hypothetical protein
VVTIWLERSRFDPETHPACARGTAVVPLDHCELLLPSANEIWPERRRRWICNAWRRPVTNRSRWRCEPPWCVNGRTGTGDAGTAFREAEVFRAARYWLVIGARCNAWRRPVTNRSRPRINPYKPARFALRCRSNPLTRRWHQSVDRCILLSFVILLWEHRTTASWPRNTAEGSTKDRREWWGCARGAQGRQRWVRAVELRPASGSQP